MTKTMVCWAARAAHATHTVLFATSRSAYAAGDDDDLIDDEAEESDGEEGEDEEGEKGEEEEDDE